MWAFDETRRHKCIDCKGPSRYVGRRCQTCSRKHGRELKRQARAAATALRRAGLLPDEMAAPWTPEDEARMQVRHAKLALLLEDCKRDKAMRIQARGW
jgi:hypothetical protein